MIHPMLWQWHHTLKQQGFHDIFIMFYRIMRVKICLLSTWADTAVTFAVQNTTFSHFVLWFSSSDVYQYEPIWHSCCSWTIFKTVKSCVTWSCEKIKTVFIFRAIWENTALVQWMSREPTLFIGRVLYLPISHWNAHRLDIPLNTHRMEADSRWFHALFTILSPCPLSTRRNSVCISR